MKRKSGLILTVLAVVVLGFSLDIGDLSADCHDEEFCNSEPYCPPPNWLLGTDTCWSESCSYHDSDGECYVCYYVGP